MSKSPAKLKNSEKEHLVTKGYLEERLDTFRVKIKSELKEEINKDFQHYIDVVMEDNRHQIKMMAEGIAMQIEASQRKWDAQEAMNTLHNWRLKRLEASVNLAEN
jgi:hypothetical protein